jgi:DNA-binding CsgD family transcriptional regulator
VSTGSGGGLVGRHEEVARLEAVLDAARAGRGQAVIVEGEPGIGKTHLAASTTALAREHGFHVAWGSAEQAGWARPFDALLAALDVDRSSPDPDRAALAALAGDTTTGGPDFVANVVEQRYRVIEGLGALVERLATKQPTLLVLDDLQWADTSTVEALASMIQRSDDLPLVVLVTTRSAPRPPYADHYVRSLLGAGAHHLVLGPLDDADVDALVTNLLGTAPSPQLRGLVTSASGNPLFIVELVESLRHQARVGHNQASLPTTTPSDQDPGPSDQDLGRRLLSRLDRLSTDGLAVVQVAAILGAPFSFDELAAVTGRAMTSLTAPVDEAVAAGLLVHRHGLLSFRHDLLRQSVYDSVVPATRRSRHHAIGLALASHGAPAAQVAHHLALGAEPGDGLAVAWLHRAATEASTRAPTVALSLVERALELVGPDDPRRATLQVDEVELLGWTGQIDRCAELARHLLSGTFDGAQRSALHRQVALCSFLRNHAVEAGEECDLAATEATDRLEQVRARAQASLAYMAAADPRARSRADEAVELGETERDALSRCVGLDVLSRLDAFELQFGASLERADQAVAIAAQDDGGLSVRYQPAFFRILTLMDLDRLEEAATELVLARRQASAGGSVWAVPLYHGVAAVVHLFRGEIDDAAAEGSAGLRVVEDIGSPLAAIWLEAALALVDLHRGALEDAATHVDAAKELVAVQVPLLGLDLLALAEARLHEAQGDRAAALRTLTDGLALVEALGMKQTARVMGPDLVRVARASGEDELVKDLTTELEHISALTDLPSDRAAAHLARGVRDGDLPELLTAVGIYEGTDYTLRLAQACVQAGMMHWERDDPEGAAALLERAMGIFGDAGARGDTQHVTQLFPALGLRRPRHRHRPSSGWESLTPSEQRIVEHVRNGMTNQVIAEQLGISRRTVETHLSHVYAKLGISSRVELAVQADRRTATN